MPEKKRFVLLIVEGQTDAIALSGPLNAVLMKKGLSQRIGVDVYGTDCLLHEPGAKNNPSFSDYLDVIQRLKRSIAAYFRQPKNKLSPNDIAAVAVVSDLDGCYCSPDSIYHNPNGKQGIHYDTTDHVIYCDDVAYIHDRNQRKVNALDLILDEHVIQIPGSTTKAVPLGVFYHNLNMEHAFYNEIGTLSQIEKMDKAQGFRSLYIHNPDGLMSFLKAINMIGMSYESSWDIASLRSKPCLRTSNISVILDWITDHLC